MGGGGPRGLGGLVPGAGHHRPPVRPACAAAPGAWCARAEDPSPGVELCLV